MVLLYGRAGRLTAKNGRFRPGQYPYESPAVEAPDPERTPGALSTPEGLAWLAANAAKEGVVVRPSGLQYKAPLARGGAAVLHRSEKDVKLAQKLGQLQPFVAVLPQECMGQLASFGPT